MFPLPPQDNGREAIVALKNSTDPPPEDPDILLLSLSFTPSEFIREIKEERLTRDKRNNGWRWWETRFPLRAQDLPCHKVEWVKVPTFEEARARTRARARAAEEKGKGKGGNN